MTSVTTGKRVKILPAIRKNSSQPIEFSVNRCRDAACRVVFLELRNSVSNLLLINDYITRIIELKNSP